MDKLPEKKEFQQISPDAMKIRGFMQTKHREIFSADPEAGEGDYGSAIVISLIAKGAMSEADLMKELLADYGETHGGEPSSEVKNRIKTTIENLVKSNVIVERDGVFGLNLE